MQWKKYISIIRAIDFQNPEEFSAASSIIHLKVRPASLAPTIIKIRGSITMTKIRGEGHLALNSSYFYENVEINSPVVGYPIVTPLARVQSLASSFPACASSSLPYV